MKDIGMIQGVNRWDRKRNEELYRQTLMVWPYHEETEEESMLRVVMKLKIKGKRPRGRLEDFVFSIN